MKKDKPKFKKWWQYLLGLVAWILIIAILFLLFMLADSAVPDGSGGDMPGHKAPVFTLLGMFVCGGLAVIFILRAIVKIIKSIRYYGQQNSDFEKLDR